MSGREVPKAEAPVVDLTQFLWWFSKMPRVIPAIDRGRGGSLETYFQQLDRSQTSNTLNDFSKTQLENSLLPTQSSIALLV